MRHSKTVESLYALVPLKLWRGFLIRRHMEKCPACLASLASREEAGELLVGEAGAAAGPGFWTKVEAVIAGDSGPEKSKALLIETRPSPPRWGWAVATAGLGVLLIGLFFLGDFRAARVPANALQARFELDYVRVGGEPANAVIYQPQGSDMIIIWAEKNL
jgi:hypothetical protein